jgi:DNA-binding NarL/FixJ family response regulator
LSALNVAKGIAPQLPFIFVSGTIGEERAIEAIRMGATDYVLKDNTRRLSTSVKRALGEALEREEMRKGEEERAHLVEILEATSDYVAMTDPDGQLDLSEWRMAPPCRHRPRAISPAESCSTSIPSRPRN